MITKILVAVDGSEHAKKAIDYAAELATKCTAELTVIHVMTRAGSSSVPPELGSYARLEHIEITEHDLLEGVANRILDQAAQQTMDAGISNVEKVLEIGDVAQTIVHYAKENSVDLIVMGSRGLNDLSGMLLGSVSHKVLHMAQCPCLTVR